MNTPAVSQTELSLLSVLPVELIQCDQWVNWRTELRHPSTASPEIDTTTTVPIVFTPQGIRRASPTNPQTWRSFAEVCAHGPHIGFMFTAEAGVVGIALDAVLVNGVLCPDAATILSHFPDAYVEYASETALHILCRGTLARGRTWRPAGGIGVAIYNHGRFAPLTGHPYTSPPPVSLPNCQPGIDWLLATARTQSPAIALAHDSTAPIAPHDTQDDFEVRAPWPPLRLDATATVPTARLEQLCATQSGFAHLWRHRTYTSSEYDLTLAISAARAGWTPQDIADLLITSRRDAHHDLKLTTPDYYYQTIAHALAQRLEAPPANAFPRRAQEAPPPCPSEPPQGPALITHLTGLSVVRYVQVGQAPASYRVHLADGDTRILGTAAMVRKQATWQDMAQEVLGVPFVALDKSQWQQFLHCLGGMVEREGVMDASARTTFLEYVAVYARQARDTLDFDDVVLGAPSVHDGMLCLNLPHFLQWLQMQDALPHGMLGHASTLLNYLRSLGALPLQVHRKTAEQQLTKRYWQIPLPHAHFLPEDPRMAAGDSQESTAHGLQTHSDHNGNEDLFS